MVKQTSKLGHHYRAWSQLLCVKAIKFTSALLVFMFVTSCGNEFETKYANPQIKEHFHNVAKGDSLENVYRHLGRPIFIQVVPDRASHDGYIADRIHNCDLGLVQNISKDSNSVIYLHYSAPTYRARGYFRYEVDIRDGKVIGVVAGELVD